MEYARFRPYQRIGFILKTLVATRFSKAQVCLSCHHFYLLFATGGAYFCNALLIYYINVGCGL
jgi:hypothetical protein